MHLQTLACVTMVILMRDVNLSVASVLPQMKPEEFVQVSENAMVQTSVNVMQEDQDNLVKLIQ